MNKIVIALLALVLLAGTACAEDMKIIIAANGKNLTATLEDNPASRALYELMPITVNMQDLYEREMCYHLPAKLPTGKLTGTNYNVGDIIYWPPRRSLVILYKQNGERFQRQHLGHIDSGVEMFETTGDTVVTFAPAE